MVATKVQSINLFYTQSEHSLPCCMTMGHNISMKSPYGDHCLFYQVSMATYGYQTVVKDTLNGLCVYTVCLLGDWFCCL